MEIIFRDTNLIRFDEMHLLPESIRAKMLQNKALIHRQFNSSNYFGPTKFFAPPDNSCSKTVMYDHVFDYYAKLLKESNIQNFVALQLHECLDKRWTNSITYVTWLYFEERSDATLLKLSTKTED